LSYAIKQNCLDGYPILCPNLATHKNDQVMKLTDMCGRYEDPKTPFQTRIRLSQSSWKLTPDTVSLRGRKE
jgi:hypothetical protein